ncbi:hypothetical protein LINPERPRIM_LOCUS7984 [Linum perenne]
MEKLASVPSGGGPAAGGAAAPAAEAKKEEKVEEKEESDDVTLPISSFAFLILKNDLCIFSNIGFVLCLLAGYGFQLVRLKGSLLSGCYPRVPF